MYIDMVLLCATDWWIFGATLFSGLATALVALYIGCQQKKLQQRQLDLEMKNNLKELNAALFEVEGRAKMFDSVALGALEASVLEPGDLYRERNLQFFEPYGQFCFNLLQRVAQSEEYAEIYLTDEMKHRMDEVYELITTMGYLYNTIREATQNHTRELHEKVIAHIDEHRISEIHLNPEKAAARLEDIVSVDENLKTRYADFKNRRNQLFKTNNIRRQLDQPSHNKKK